MRLLSHLRRRGPMCRSERFLLAGARQSRALGHSYVGTEHVLLALTDDPDTRAARALERLGVTPEVVRCDIERIIGRDLDRQPGAIDSDALATLGIDLEEVTRRVEDTFGPGALGNAGRACGCIAPRLRKALELAVGEAGNGSVRSDHVLVSLALVEDCVAARILREHGVSRDLLRHALQAAP